eukprot:CAMPEP_0178936896 /NCGR_PEP_ID=MMETSP0786-20121207/25440_1 /TAXON_ID=186022 /ORGANISM="Thalassionema frauenfeldii, Strain CCMP 1798" /LENGTH=124 /DNA_ID=CAMNT_0020615375 /DNA_START=323 /DNA_END=697 /DNA_ORIENTATION=+
MTLFVWAIVAASAVAFAPIATSTTASKGSLLLHNSHDVAVFVDPPSQIFMTSSLSSSSSELVSIDTLDPTQFLSDVLGSVIGGPAILLVPILAAVAVASLVAFLIVGYAAPQVEDDVEEEEEDY